MDVAQLLLNSLSTDKSLREPATQMLHEAAKNSLATYLSTLTQILSSDVQDVNVRRAAGLVIKNSLSARDSERLKALVQQWMQLDVALRQHIKQVVLQTLGTQEARVGSTAAQVVDAIAQIELPLNQWPDLIQSLLASITSASSSVLLRRIALEALGYICEGIDANILQSQSNQILTAVVSGARKEEPNTGVRQAAMRALFNSLGFIRSNFENEAERNYLMQVVCEATQSTDVALQTIALECLVEIAHLHYDKMSSYMDKGLVGLTLQLLTRYLQSPHSVDDAVALQAIEFWSTISDEELSLQIDREDALENNEPFDRPFYGFTQQYASMLVPLLTQLLIKTEDNDGDDADDEEDEWNVHLSAGTSLSLLSSCIRDHVVQFVLPFVQQHIQNAQSHAHREAAVMAFGAILEGPSGAQLRPLASVAFPVLLGLMKDKNTRVRDTTAWTLGRICELVPDAIQLHHEFSPLLTAILDGLRDSPRVASKCAWTLRHIAGFFGEDAVSSDNVSGVLATNPTSTPLEVCFEPCVKALLAATERADGQSNNLRMAAYESLSVWIQYAPENQLETVQQLALVLIQRLSTSLATQSLSADDRMRLAEVQGELCGVLQAMLHRLPPQRIAQFADNLMALFLQLFSSQAARTSGLLEDALLAIGAMIHRLEGHFARYTESFLPILVAALANHAEHQVCRIAIGLVGDLCRALGEGILPYCDTIVTHLIQNLQSASVHRDVKPPILSCFGDIALAISSHYISYLKITMTVLSQAAKVLPANPNVSDDMTEYMETLMLCIVEGYTGIVQGLKSSEGAQPITPEIAREICCLIEYIGGYGNRPDELTRAAVGLLGDLVDTLGIQMAPLVTKNNVYLSTLVQDARTSSESSTKEIGKWAYVILKRIQS